MTYMRVNMGTGCFSGGEPYTVFFARTSNWDVVLIKNDADFFHKTDLLLIVALQVVVVAGSSVRVCEVDIDTRKQLCHVVCGDYVCLGSRGHVE